MMMMMIFDFFGGGNCIFFFRFSLVWLMLGCIPGSASKVPVGSGGGGCYKVNIVIVFGLALA